MVARVVIERRVIPGKERQVLDLLKQLRIGCLDQPGYESSETLLDTQDRECIVVISNWRHPGYWREWAESPKRKSVEDQLGALLVEPEKVRVFADGVSAEYAGA